VSRRSRAGVALALFVYRRALRALPASLRRSAAVEMAGTFRRLALRWRRRGLGALARGTAAEVWDVVRAGVRSRVNGGGRGGERAGVGGGGRGRTGMAGVLGLAVRRIVRRPGYACAFAGTLGAGVAVAAAMFAVVSAVVLRPPPYRDVERLVYVWSMNDERQAEMPGVDVASLLAWRSLGVFDGFEAYQRADRVITRGGPPEQVVANYVTPGMFSFLGVGPILGRGFLPDEGHIGGERTVIVSHTLWTRRYGRDPSVLGRTLELNGEPHTVVGVMGRGFTFPEDSEAWLPVAWATDALGVVGGGQGVARLPAGLDLDAANERVEALTKGDATLRPTGYRPYLVEPFYLTTNDRTKLQLVVFFGAVLLVLAIALANVVSLGVAGAVGRRRELAIHMALGAGRGRLVLQLVAESTLLAAAGAAFGLVLAAGMLQALVPLMQEVLRLNTGGRVPSIWPDGLVFAAGAAALAGPTVGLLTAALARAGAAGTPLNSRSNTDERGSVRLQKSLIVAEVALALILVSGAGLLLNSVVRLVQRDPGFDVERLVTLTLRLQSYRHPTADARAAFFRRVEDALGALPGVTGVVAVQTDFPRSGARFRPVLRTEDGATTPPLGDGGAAAILAAGSMFLPEVIAGPGFHEVVGTPILRGRGFAEADASTPVVIVNETLARRLWPTGSAIGRQLRITERDDWRTVIGVAADAIQMGLRDEWGDGMEFYTPLAPAPRRADLSFVLRTEGPPALLLDRVREAVWSLDPDQPMERLTTVEDAMADSLLRERFFLGLIAAFAILATLLAAIGLHAVLSQIVARRTREIGIRVALGARARDVVRSAVGVAAVLVAVGIVIGTAASVALTRFLQSLLFGVEPWDPATMAVNILVLLGAAFAACLMPTRRALGVDPVRALGAD
jgi:putative ABC transport system permease protein